MKGTTKLSNIEKVDQGNPLAPSLDRESLPSGRRFDVIAGSLSGLVGIGCCVYPVALVLIGAATAAEAVALGLSLYGEWGWLFKLGGAALVVAAFFLQRRRAAACRIANSPVRSFIAIGLTAVTVYFLVYGVTTFLARIA